MKLSYVPLVCLMFTVSCGKSLLDMLHMGKQPVEKHESDPMFNKYLKEFEDEFNATVTVPIILKSLDGDRAGACFFWSNGYREVQINPKYWSSFSEEQKQQLVFHELGHCVFNLDHDDSNMSSKKYCPNSVMRSFMFSQSEITSCYIPEYSHYIGDMNAKR